ncbi:helix-turn-helix domain-containing protein [Serratia marcescens]|nr:helix-turn-helix domain-containing protein [Serratia marcescens]ELQ9442099.1 helix-turn-helix domain-containing protein [Serratia marcescens]ELT5562889.1 helix-turn-helix domain-containing protein [Serratia marcescens]
MFIAKVIEELLAWVEESGFNENLTVEMLSEKSGYSRAHIQKAFKDETGMTFGSYVRGRKLIRAAFMLKATNLSISNIVTELKFQSYQSFERAFRKQFRTSPMQYRKSKSWDVSSAIPLLFLDGIPEHRYVHLPKFFDDSGDGVDVDMYHFHSAFSELRLAAINNMKKTDSVLINFFNIGASIKKENFVSIYLKTLYIAEEDCIGRVLASLADAQGKKDMQLFAEFCFDGASDEAQKFTQSIYTKSFPINKVGIVDRFLIETIIPRGGDRIELKTYIPIVFPIKHRLKDVVTGGMEK